MTSTRQAPRGPSLGAPIDGPLAKIDVRKSIPPEVDLASYDYIVICMSGGKDSIASVLTLLDAGADPNVIELHHHRMDGDGPPLMEWAWESSYCRRLAEALGLKIYFSWREGGFAAEMDRDNAPTGAVCFESPEGFRRVGGNSKSLGTRGLFPQKTNSLRTRWCSATGKIDVLDAVLRNQDRFLGKRTLVVDGTRAQESTGRAGYETFEVHRADARAKKQRHVDTLRCVHAWSEAEVCEILRQHGVVPSLAYWLGFSRQSCMACIFLGSAGYRTLLDLFPSRFSLIEQREARSGKTITMGRTVREIAMMGEPYSAALQRRDLIGIALDDVYRPPVLCDPALWSLPPGAFGKAGEGPG